MVHRNLIQNEKQLQPKISERKIISHISHQFKQWIISATKNVLIHENKSTKHGAQNLDYKWEMVAIENKLA